MRGKLAKTEANILRIMAFLNLPWAGYNIRHWTIHHDASYLVVGIVGVLISIFAFTRWYLINHPKIPKWAEDSLEGHPKVYKVGDKR